MTIDLDARRKAVELWKAWGAAEAAHDAARFDLNRGKLPPETVAAIADVEREYDRRFSDLNTWKRERMRGVTGSVGDDLGCDREAAYSAYLDNGCGLLVDDYNKPVLCAKSGIPILEDDEIVEDPETGEVYLRSALGLPPRPEKDGDDPE